MYRNVVIVLAEIFRMLAIFGPFLQIYYLILECLYNVKLTCDGAITVVITHCVRAEALWEPHRFEFPPPPFSSHFTAQQWCLLTHPDFILCMLIVILFLVPFTFCLVLFISKDNWAPWRWYVNLYRPLHDALISFLMTPDFAVLVLSFLFMILTWLLGIGIFQY